MSKLFESVIASLVIDDEITTASPVDKYQLGINQATQLSCAPVFSNGELIIMLVVTAMYSYALLILPKPLIR